MPTLANCKGSTPCLLRLADEGRARSARRWVDRARAKCVDCPARLTSATSLPCLSSPSWSRLSCRHQGRPRLRLSGHQHLGERLRAEAPLSTPLARYAAQKRRLQPDVRVDPFGLAGPKPLDLAVQLLADPRRLALADPFHPERFSQVVDPTRPVPSMLACWLTAANLVERWGLKRRLRLRLGFASPALEIDKRSNGRRHHCPLDRLLDRSCARSRLAWRRAAKPGVARHPIPLLWPTT